MKRNKKLLAITLLTVGVSLLAVTGCSQKVKSLTLGVTEIGEIESVDYKMQSGSSTLLYSDNWYWEKDPAFPLDQEDAVEAVNLLGHITVMEQLDDVDELSEYGLRSPAHTITLNDKDGKTKTVLIGYETEDKHFYATDEKKEVVYIIDGEIKDALEFLEDSLLQIQLLDAVSSPTPNSSQGTE